MDQAAVVDQRSRCWCFTINNPKRAYGLDVYYTEELGNNVKNYSYIVWGYEIGKNGTPHFQCFIIMKKRTKLSTMRKMIPGAHFESMYSNSEAAANYCKEDGLWQECGVFEYITKKGGECGGLKKGRNYKRIICLAKAGDMDKIEEEDASAYFLHYRTIKLIMADNPPQVQDLDRLNNEWIYGKTGVGKSRTARLENPVFYLKGLNKWWTGYKGEEVVIIDDIGKSHATWIGDFLKHWLDYGAFRVDIHFSSSYIRPKKIICTSNYSIEELWPEEEMYSPILRRVKVRHMVKAIVFE